jgi:hypothetical protein
VGLLAWLGLNNHGTLHQEDEAQDCQTSPKARCYTAYMLMFFTQLSLVQFAIHKSKSSSFDLNSGKWQE